MKARTALSLATLALISSFDGSKDLVDAVMSQAPRKGQSNRPLLKLPEGERPLRPTLPPGAKLSKQQKPKRRRRGRPY